MQTVRWVRGVFRSPRQFARAAGALLRCGFERRDFIEEDLFTRVSILGSEERQDVAANRTRCGEVLELITLRAAIYALEGIGPVTEGSPIDPLLAEAYQRIPIWIRCADRRKTRLAVALLRGVGAQEVSTDGCTIG